MSRKVNDWIESYLRYTENSEPPYLFRKWAAISVIASALQRKCYLPWGSLTFYPNMYIILVGPSGKSRKGTAMSPALDILMEVSGIKLAAEAITREALIRELKNASDTVIHPVTGKMNFHASLTVHSQELTVFLGYHNYALMSDLTDWYDCRKRWTYRTKHMGTDEIIGVWVNIIGATTPELIQSSMPLDAVGGGLTSRMIFVFEHKKGKIVPDPFLTKEEMDLRELLVVDLEKIKMLQGPFRVSEQFVETWAKWYTAQDENPPFRDDRFSGYFERRPTHVMKMSMILNSSRTDSMVISEDDLLNAIQLLKDTEQKMSNTFSGVGKSSHAEVLSKVMAEVGRTKETTIANLMNIFYRDVSNWEMEGIIKTLEAMKFCVFVTNTGVIRLIGESDNDISFQVEQTTMLKK